MIPYLIMGLSLLLDGLLTNYLPYVEGTLTLFTPLLTVVSIFMIYPFFKKQEKKYYVIAFILGILYDLFYTNLLFFNGLLFLGIACFTRWVHKNYEINSIRLLLYLFFVIVLYESLTGMILYIFQLVPITFMRVFYKITHSLLLNILYGEVLYFILKWLPKKYKKTRLN